MSEDPGKYKVKSPKVVSLSAKRQERAASNGEPVPIWVSDDAALAMLDIYFDLDLNVRVIERGDPASESYEQTVTADPRPRAKTQFIEDSERICSWFNMLYAGQEFYDLMCLVIVMMDCIVQSSVSQPQESDMENENIDRPDTAGTPAVGPASAKRRPLTKWICHKVVEAEKIKRRVMPEKPGDPWVLIFENPYAPPLEVSDKYIGKHNPQPGMYYVRYQDGYESCSPASEFENGYINTTGLSMDAITQEMLSQLENKDL